MPPISYSLSRMLCHIAIGFFGGLLFISTSATSPPDRAGSPQKTELLRFLSTAPSARP